MDPPGGGEWRPSNARPKPTPDPTDPTAPSGPVDTPGTDPFGGNRPLQPLPDPRAHVQPHTDSQALSQLNNRKRVQRAGAILMEEMLLPPMGAFAMAIQEELDIEPGETMAFAERVETEKGNSALLDYVNANTRRIAPKSAREKPGMSRYQSTPLYKAARTDPYTGSRWSSRTEQSKVTELLRRGSMQEAKAAETIDVSESLASWQQRQDGYERQILPKDLSHFI